jgi:hypothetical protein
MSRRCSFRLQLVGLLAEAWAPKFENAFVVQFSDVSREIREAILPSADAPGKAAHSELTAGSFAHEQATIQSRCSAPAGDLADQIPRRAPCDNVQTERLEEPAHRRDLVLLDKAHLTKVPSLELSQRERRNRQAGHIRHHTLEPHSFRFRLQIQRAGNPCGTGRALPHLLAADFCFHLPARLLNPGR